MRILRCALGVILAACPLLGLVTVLNCLQLWTERCKYTLRWLCIPFQTHADQQLLVIACFHRFPFCEAWFRLADSSYEQAFRIFCQALHLTSKPAALIWLKVCKLLMLIYFVEIIALWVCLLFEIQHCEYLMRLSNKHMRYYNCALAAYTHRICLLFLTWKKIR